MAVWMHCLHSMVVRWQLRRLDEQADCIVDARRVALLRLQQIRHEQMRKQGALKIARSSLARRA